MYPCDDPPLIPGALRLLFDTPHDQDVTPTTLALQERSHTSTPHDGQAENRLTADDDVEENDELVEFPSDGGAEEEQEETGSGNHGNSVPKKKRKHPDDDEWSVVNAPGSPCKRNRHPVPMSYEEEVLPNDPDGQDLSIDQTPAHLTYATAVSYTHLTLPTKA